jgi:hypothetical protein
MKLYRDKGHVTSCCTQTLCLLGHDAMKSVGSYEHGTCNMEAELKLN